jgi:hypothetical protein
MLELYPRPIGFLRLPFWRRVGRFSGKINVKPSMTFRRFIAQNKNTLKLTACWNLTIKLFILHYNHVRR